jgi:GAF domain-containing protein
MDKLKIDKLIQLGQMIEKSSDLEKTIKEITQQLKEIIEVQRVSIFIYSHSANMVWTYLADGIEKLILGADKGIVGYVITHKTIKKVNDTSKDPFFYKEVDESTGYKTKNILTVPLLKPDNSVLGVIQLLNKKTNFTKDDVNIAYLFSQYLATPLERLIDKHKSLKIGENDDYFI